MTTKDDIIGGLFLLGAAVVAANAMSSARSESATPNTAIIPPMELPGIPQNAPTPPKGLTTTSTTQVTIGPVTVTVPPVVTSTPVISIDQAADIQTYINNNAGTAAGVTAINQLATLAATIAPTQNLLTPGTAIGGQTNLSVFPLTTSNATGYYGGIYNYYYPPGTGVGIAPQGPGYYVPTDDYYSPTSPEIGNGGLRNTTVVAPYLTAAMTATIIAQDPLHLS